MVGWFWVKLPNSAESGSFICKMSFIISAVYPLSEVSRDSINVEERDMKMWVSRERYLDVLLP
jgi:hypothetical protein